MTGTTAPRRRFPVTRANRRQSLQLLIVEWLVTLPAHGWTGTVSALELSLYRTQARTGLPAVIPSGSGLAIVLRDERETFAALGFAITFNRTASTRTIHITPAG